MIALAARFRNSRTAGAGGTVCYTLRRGSDTRCIVSELRGADAEVLRTESARLAFDMATICCVATELAEAGDADNLDAVAVRSREALAGCNPYAAGLRACAGRWPVSKDVGSVAKAYADFFEYRREEAPAVDNGTLDGYLERIGAEYRAAGKPFAKAVRATQLSLRTWLHGGDVALGALMPEFVRSYRTYLQGRVSTDTVSFYMRTLRTAMKRAAAENRLPEGFEWPDEIKSTVSRTSTRSESNVLSLHDLSRLERMHLSAAPALELARDVFMFSFYAGGMELVDVAALTADNLSDGVLTYRRRRRGAEVRVELGAKALAIVEKYRTDGRNALFPLTERERTYAFGTVRNEVGASLAAIGERLKLPVRLRFSMSHDTLRAALAAPGVAERIACRTATSATATSRCPRC